MHDREIHAAGWARGHGQQGSEGRVDTTVPMVFSMGHTADIGRNTGSSVSDDDSTEESLFNARDQLGADRPRRRTQMTPTI